MESKKFYKKTKARPTATVCLPTSSLPFPLSTLPPPIRTFNAAFAHPSRSWTCSRYWTVS